VALEPRIATRASRHAVEIECDSELTRGMTVVDALDVLPPRLADASGWSEHAVKGERLPTVVWQIDVRRFKERLFRALG
jgi:inosine-uridine nucleoside N-ribohydrolase